MFSKVFITSLFASVALAAVQIHPTGINTKCLDVRGDVLANGTAVDIWDCNGTGAQQWLINRGNTKVQLANTNFCLDAGSGNPPSGTKMKIWTCFTDIPDQAWTYTTSNTITLGTSNQCLDLTNGNLTDGNPVQTWQCTAGDKNQIWTTTPPI